MTGEVLRHGMTIGDQRTMLTAGLCPRRATADGADAKEEITMAGEEQEQEIGMKPQHVATAKVMIAMIDEHRRVRHGSSKRASKSRVRFLQVRVNVYKCHRIMLDYSDEPRRPIPPREPSHGSRPAAQSSASTAPSSATAPAQSLKSDGPELELEIPKPIDPEALIAERRRKRAEILAKYANTAPPSETSTRPGTPDVSTPGRVEVERETKRLKLGTGGWLGKPASSASLTPPFARRVSWSRYASERIRPRSRRRVRPVQRRRAKRGDSSWRARRFYARRRRAGSVSCRL